ncbi:MAG: type II toxin-antitoxin system VapC family toxin [Terriglobales bacterium]
MILDASVAAKWCLPDEGNVHADALLECHVQGRVRFIVPDLFWTELTNLLARAVRRRRIDARAAAAALNVVLEYKLPTIATGDLCSEALELACRWHWPVQDLFYVLLARSLGEDLITADERLVRALGSRFPVRWLGTLDL